MEIRASIRNRPIVEWLAWVLLSELAGLIGGVATASAVETWYTTLAQPSFAPPDWVFGPVWTTLYALMGTAAFLVSRSDDSRTRPALYAFVGHLGLNVSWSLAFFGLQSPLYGLVVIVPLLVAIVAVTALFGRVDRRAAALMLPYLVWVAFATALNYQFWALN
ncbi:tryptophan-rich sensory protein [Halogeometricum borinquense]|uniref:Tryptophan-rich sensory protein n=1 Tax=Halogeometricum borinquense TaxID=60847 RepID=A0A6C0UCE1_9EURY|nr:TspO/MBR family protein [Halogeometricum borinquense]QIB72925.1 tryptophan-rich sensory protein [Halogeometricum borinquense]QIQ75116.1 tryptophan-rich sensory protein [Halogeometricum borinquense]